MTSRRTFLRTAAAGAALAALGDARALFAESLATHAVARGRLPTPDDYLLDPGVHYLNHGSIGTVPRIVHEAHAEYLRICESNPWLYMWSEPWVEPIEEVRRRGARLLGCDPEELAITHNTTEGFNLLAHGLPLDPGDEVIFSSLNHPGASLPWLHQAPVRGFEVRQFALPVPEIASLTTADVVEMHLREIGPRTRVLVVPHVDNLVGLRHPIGPIAEGARALGVEFVAVDGAQSVSMIPVDVAAAGVDAYAASPHKWVQSPKGLGLLYLRHDLHDRVHPMWVSSGRPRARDSIRRFEDYGTRNRPEVMALGDAFAYQERIAMADREEGYEALWRAARERVEAAPGLRWRSPSRWELSAPLFTVEAEGRPSAPLSNRLFEEEGIVVRPIPSQGIDGIRISPNLQTSFAEVEACLRFAEG